MLRCMEVTGKACPRNGAPPSLPESSDITAQYLHWRADVSAAFIAVGCDNHKNLLRNPAMINAERKSRGWANPQRRSHAEQPDLILDPMHGAAHLYAAPRS